VADEHLGKAIRCGKCQRVIETHASENIVATLPPEPVVAASPPEPVLPRAPFAPRRKRRLKKKDYQRHRFPVRTAVAIGLGGFCFLVAAGFAFWFVRYGTRFRLAGIPDQKWQALEVPNRLRVRLPGPAQKVTQPVAGMTMIMHQYQPDPHSIYAVAYMEGTLPENRRSLPVETLLNDSCNGSVANLQAQGGVEESRRSVQLGPHPGKELVVNMVKADGKMVSRVYIAHGRLYIVMAGGLGLHADHENVKRLFDSFEILEKPGDATTPAAPPATPPAGGPLTKPADSSKPPFKVDPKLTGEWSEVYLSDMTEFDVKMGPWKFGKNGVLGDPGNKAIAIGAKKYPKGLSMHPAQSGAVRVRYALGKKAAKFVASVALNEYPTPAQGQVTFEVLGDNKVLWTSKPIQNRGDIQECKVDVSTVSILELRVTVSGSYWNAHAVWLDPRVLKK
jgi:hypothetical protein